MKKWFSLFIILLIAFAAIYIKEKKSTEVIQSLTLKNLDQEKGLNRNPSKINYSNHARCRMKCRNIDEKEVTDLIKTGKINYSKSDLNEEECKNKYALESNSRDNQNLRIIVSPCGSEETIITVIDLNKEWKCNCPGDN